MRMYIGEALAPEEIQAISAAPTPLLNNYYKCSPLSSETNIDATWANGYGQDCQWLFENKAQYPGCFLLTFSLATNL